MITPNSPRPWLISIWASAAAFTAYFSMYGFRKPFAVAKFSGQHFLGTEIELKTAIVISQIVGYAISKYLGVRFCSELDRRRSARVLVGLIGVAFLALLTFAIAPPQYRVVAIFFNGLPLGMVWGLVVRFLEGRRTSDVILSVLCFSFLIASGIVKDIGRWLMTEWSITEAWMPFATSCVFIVPFVLAVVALAKLPPPDARDISARVARVPMDQAARYRFLFQFAGGLIPLIAAYCLLTAYRDYRDNYGIEMLTELGYERSNAVFTKLELPVGVLLLGILGLLVVVKNHRLSLRLIFAMMIGGAVVLGVANLLFIWEWISGFAWMVLVGLGAYLIYVPYNAVLFERMIAVTGTVATAVFVIYVADALGYTGSVIVQLYKDLIAGEESRLSFFVGFTWILTATAATCLVLSYVYFDRIAIRLGAATADTNHEHLAR